MFVRHISKECCEEILIQCCVGVGCGQKTRGHIFKTSWEDLWKTSFPKKECTFSKLLWKNLGKYIAKHQPCLRKESCIIITKFVQKYAMLTLSLDVICDVTYCLHHIVVKSAMSK